MSNGDPATNPMHDVHPQVFLRLNKQALDALFPEGSQARVDLQNSVIKHLIEKLESKHLHETLAQHVAKLEDYARMQAGQFETQIEQHANAAIKAYFPAGDAVWNYSQRKLGAETIKRIQDLVALNINSTIQQELMKLMPSEVIQAAITTKLAEIVGSDVTTVKHKMRLLIKEVMKETLG